MLEECCKARGRQKLTNALETKTGGEGGVGVWRCGRRRQNAKCKCNNSPAFRRCQMLQFYIVLVIPQRACVRSSPSCLPQPPTTTAAAPMIPAIIIPHRSRWLKSHVWPQLDNAPSTNHMSAQPFSSAAAIESFRAMLATVRSRTPPATLQPAAIRSHFACMYLMMPWMISSKVHRAPEITTESHIVSFLKDLHTEIAARVAEVRPRFTTPRRTTTLAFDCAAAAVPFSIARAECEVRFMTRLLPRRKKRPAAGGIPLRHLHFLFFP
jgi:hypothetical protein